MSVCVRLLALATVLSAVVTAASAITLGQMDDFQDGTAMGWDEGVFSPNPPTNQPNGGPAGAGDRYLRDSSSGGLGAGSKLVMYNQVQWTGDYLSAGVTRIEMNLANFGGATLRMRIAIEGAATRYASTTAFVLPPDGVWRSATFPLSASDLTNVGGLGTVNDVLASVVTVRILSSTVPAWQGDTIAATVGADNILAAGSGAPPPPPVPDGTFGSAMLASRTNTSGSTIQLSWDVAPCPATGYHVLFGDLASVSSLAIGGGVCAIGASGAFSWTTVPAGNRWFLVVSDDGATTEGSWGQNSSGAQRGGTASSNACGMANRSNAGTCP